MIKFIFSLVVVSVFCAGCVVSPPVNPNEPSDISGQQLLRVGMTTNAPPMAYRERGKITGLEAAFASELAQYSKRNLRFVTMAWEELIPALLAGKIDIIMSSMTVTNARKYQIAFAKPYMVTGQIALVRLSEYHRFSDGFPGLLNPTVRVGTVKATTGDLLIVQNKAKGAVIQYSSATDGIQGLLDNKIDAFVYDLPMNLYFGAKYTDKGLTPVTVPMTREFIAWGLRKDDQDLLLQANGYLDKITSSGHLQQMVVHWIPFYERLYNK